MESRIESYDIHGGKVLIFGDMHMSSSFQGQHKNYQYECYYNMERIMELVQTEKASAVVLLGDIIGVSERQIRDYQMLSRVLNFFYRLNAALNGNVFSVKGNHDIGDFTGFDMLIQLGLIKNPLYLNYYGRRPGAFKDDDLEVRFHLVNYGDEQKALRLTGDDSLASDVVLGHCDYYIDGVTNWYSAGGNTELSNLSNYMGVSLVISGHIHTPSDELLYTTLKNGESIGLFYTGSMGRVSERYDDCWYIVFEYSQSDGADDWSTAYDARLFGLQPADEVYYPKEEIIGEEDAEVAEARVKSDALTDIVKEIVEGRITSGDLNKQIDIVPGVSQEVKDIAKRYLSMAILESK